MRTSAWSRSRPSRRPRSSPLPGSTSSSPTSSRAATCGRGCSRSSPGSPSAAGGRRRCGSTRRLLSPVRERSSQPESIAPRSGCSSRPRSAGIISSPRLRAPSTTTSALPPGCLNFDLGNACLGFVNAIHLAATAIDAGQTEYALVVDGEGARHTQLTTIARLQEHAETTSDVYDEFASLTLGSGAAAMVLGSLDSEPRRTSPRRRDLAGGDAAPRDLRRRPRADDDRHEGPARGGARAGRRGVGRVGGRFRLERRTSPGTSSTRSARCTRACCARRSASTKPRAPLTFPTYGNIGPASIPFTLAEAQGRDRRRRARALHGHGLRPERQRRRDHLVRSAPAAFDAGRLERLGIEPAWSRSVRRPGRARRARFGSTPSMSGRRKASRR